MSCLKKILRQVIVVICGVSCLANMLGLPVGAVATLMHGEHEATTVAHDGHHDLILLHRDAAQAETCAHQTEHLEAQQGHHHENHVFHLASNESAFLPSAAAPQAPTVAALMSCVAEFVLPSRSSWQSAKFHPNPPPPLDGVMGCLRTTVLVV